MAEHTPPKSGLVEWVDTPAAQPLRVPAHRWQQAGYDVFSGLCPVCCPGVTLAQINSRLMTEGHGHVHVNQPGRIICRCGAYLELYEEEGT